VTRAEFDALSEDVIDDLCRDALFGDEAGVEVVCPASKGPDHDCGHTTDPDGRCPCGCPSVLVLMGF
jgi:hypothetical protein